MTLASRPLDCGDGDKGLKMIQWRLGLGGEAGSFLDCCETEGMRCRLVIALEVERCR